MDCELIDRQALRAAHGLGSDCHDCKRDMKSCQYDRDYSLMDFCEWLDDAPTASPWHRVEERLPPMLYQAEGDDFCIDYSLIVLAYREASHDFYLARQMDDGHGATWGTDCFDELYGVTHWMPLPEPPKEDA